MSNVSTGTLVRLLLAIILFGGLMIGMMVTIDRQARRIRELENAPTDTVTVVRHDTIKVDSPVEVHHYIKEKEYVAVTDSVLVHDTLTQTVMLPREYKVYGDTSYRAVVSGVEPRLDSLEIYRKTYVQVITKTITKTDKKRWGLGVSVGAGWNGKKVQPFVGAGVQYNILRW